MTRTVPARALRALGIAAALVLPGCSDKIDPFVPDSAMIARMTITAQPGSPTIAPTLGWSALALDAPRDGRMYVPASYDAAAPARLLVLLHGAGVSSAMFENATFQAWADANGLVLLAIDSRFPTWDLVVTGEYDEDVAFLNEALLHTFARINVDPARIAIGGFSDGASEAIGVGVANAGLFRKIIAFSPGMAVMPFRRGSPAVFVSAGDADTGLFLNARDNIVPTLRANGMATLFLPFQGGHSMPEGVIAEAFEWLLEL